MIDNVSFHIRSGWYTGIRSLFRLVVLKCLLIFKSNGLRKSENLY